MAALLPATGLLRLLRPNPAHRRSRLRAKSGRSLPQSKAAVPRFSLQVVPIRPETPWSDPTAANGPALSLSISPFRKNFLSPFPCPRQRVLRARTAPVPGLLFHFVIPSVSSPDFLHFFRKAETDLRAFIGSVIRDSHAREDIFQEVSRTLWQKFDDYDLSRSFGAWARGIASRKILEARRRSARFPLLFPPETVEAIAEAFDESDEPAAAREAALKLCLDALPPRSRQILTARYDQRQPCEQIAQATGMNLKAIHQTLSRLRRGLHRCITARLENEDFLPVPVLAEAAEAKDHEDGNAERLTSESIKFTLPAHHE
jgi:RNA polymerase sigma-70 factor (ECF subfamily)